jgi:hypothetical protein
MGEFERANALSNKNSPLSFEGEGDTGDEVEKTSQEKND